VARIDPHKGQTVRIFFTGESLPTDRETVFWLNLLDVPPAPGADAPENSLQLAFRSRIKLFYRPSGLEGSPEQAPEKLTWNLQAAPGGKTAVKVTNPTPYHVSFSAFEVGAAKFDEGGMVGPGETRVFDLKGSAGSSTTVTYHAISDYGGFIDGEAVIGTK
jgi:P pilus assembly chaperone PapD